MLEPKIRDEISRENRLTAMEEGRTSDSSKDDGGNSKKNSGGNNQKQRCLKCGNYHSGECKNKRQYGGDGDRVGKGSGSTPRFNKYQKEYLKAMGFDWKPKGKRERRRYRDYSSDSNSSSSSDSDSDAPRRRRKKTKKSKSKWSRIPAAEKSMMMIQAGYDPTEVDNDFVLQMSDDEMEESRRCARKSIKKARRHK